MDTPSTQKTSIWKILGIVLGILVLGFIALIFFGADDYNRDGDAIAARTQQVLSQFKNGKIDDLYREADPIFTQTTTKAELENITKTFPILVSYTTLKTDKIEHDDKTAKVNGTLTDEKNKPSTFVLNLTKIDNTWKFYSMDINGKVDTATTATDTNLGQEDATAKIKQIRVGDGFDADGLVASATRPVIAIIASSIFVSVITTQSAPTVMANVKMVHIATSDMIEQTLPIHKSTTGTQFNTRFQFTKPANDWPKGKSKIVVTLANGDTKEITYDVK